MKRILVVDDETIIRKVAINTLQSESYEILEAANGEEALRIVVERSPHLVLLDINMPGMSGLDVCRKIKGNPATRSTFVVILSANAEDEDLRLGEDAGADDYFGKPFSPLDLLNKVNALLGGDHEGVMQESQKDKPVSYGRQLIGREADLNRLERSQLLMYARDLNRVFQEELQKSQELRKANERLKEMERMKDVFISLVSHELRTPLSIIKGYVQLMTEAMKNSGVAGELSEFMKAIANASGRLEGLIQELLDFSKMKSGLIAFEMKEINLPALLQLIHRELLPTARAKDQEMTLEIRTEVHPLRGDSEKLRDAFAHLIRNAINFTPRGGRVWIEYFDEGVLVKVRICDSGIGIPREEQEKIFSPFYQVAEVHSRSVDGLGLGLSITKHLIEDHGGTITVESVEKEGTVFTVTLPRSRRDAMELVSDQRTVRPASIEDMSRHIEQAEGQLLMFARDMSDLYAQEKLKSKTLEETLDELERTYFQTIAALARIVDIKDAYLGEHTDRVSHYANVIAKHLNP
jgi:signal transduction histidine kinase